MGLISGGRALELATPDNTITTGSLQAGRNDISLQIEFLTLTF